MATNATKPTPPVKPDPRIAKLEGLLATAKKERYAARKEVATLKAEMEAASQPVPAGPPSREVVRPEPGDMLEINQVAGLTAASEGAFGAAGANPAQIVLTDTEGYVLPLPIAVVSADDFTPAAFGGLTYGRSIDILPEHPEVWLRTVWLVDADGRPVASCRLGAALPGGGGNKAQVPAKTILFRFGE